MIANQSLKTDDRTVTLLRANVWGYNFIVFALLIDIMYRSAIRREAPWDLFALLGAAGAISMAYAARHKVKVFSWKFALVIVVSALVAAVVSGILAYTEAL